MSENNKNENTSKTNKVVSKRPHVEEVPIGKFDWAIWASNNHNDDNNNNKFNSF